MSIASELATLAANKAAIKAAIEAKSPTVMPTDALAQWPAAIASIPSGGGSVGYTLTVLSEFTGFPPVYDSLLVVYCDGSVETINTWDVLYMEGSLVLQDVVGYMKLNSNTSKYDSYTALQGNTTITAETQCLLRGTLVTLADGSSKPIEDVTYDDDLLVWDFERGETASAKPLWIKRAERTWYKFDVRLMSGRTLAVTGPHGHRAFNIDQSRFEYLPRSVGDRVYTLDGEDAVVACEKVTGDFEHFNIITAGHLNLFANGVLTSCRLNNYRSFNAKKMTWASQEFMCRLRHSFQGVSDEWMDGLKLRHQPGDTDAVHQYVARLAANALPRKGRAPARPKN